MLLFISSFITKTKSKELCNDRKSYFPIPISLPPNISHSLKYQRSTTSVCIGIRKLGFVTFA